VVVEQRLIRSFHGGSRVALASARDGAFSRTLDVDFNHGEAATPGLGSITAPEFR
jgi:hypothetical protein